MFILSPLKAKMDKKILPLLILVFSLFFQHGDAAVAKCPISPVTGLIYFDLEQLLQTALEQEYNDTIHSPILCEGGNDRECSKQQCCYGEVGCCYIDPNNHLRKCGCKQIGSNTCTYPAPLAILANSKCDTDKKMETSVCLREIRADEEKTISIRNNTLQTYTEANKIPTPRKWSDVLLAVGNIVSNLIGGLKYKKTPSAGLIDQKERCPLIGISSLVYLDLEQLSLGTLHHGSSGVIQSPQTCMEENGGDCSKQQCCHGEVGCCFSDDNEYIRKCGCKKPEDKTCTYPAPLVILASSECHSEQIGNVSTCLRERRENEENFISTKESALQPDKVISSSPASWIVLILAYLI